MRAIILLSLAILFVWFLITRFEPGNETVTLTEEYMKQQHREVVFVWFLWVIMMTLQGLLSYKLYRLIPGITGIYKTCIKAYLIIVGFLLLFSMMIFVMGHTSFWF